MNIRREQNIPRDASNRKTDRNWTSGDASPRRRGRRVRRTRVWEWKTKKRIQTKHFSFKSYTPPPRVLCVQSIFFVFADSVNIRFFSLLAKKRETSGSVWLSEDSENPLNLLRARPSTYVKAIYSINNTCVYAAQNRPIIYQNK